MNMTYRDYLQEDMFPHMWCSGCSHGIVLGSIARSLATLNIPPARTVAVSGIGCWGKSDEYFKTHALHGTHGRALAFSTGIKIAKPELTVLTLMGDGDSVTIGGNHFIHAARRNIDVTAIVTNNFNYGMTGGQYSASSPEGSFSATSRFGTAEPGFDICELARVAGATFVARATPYHITLMDKLITQAIEHKGFSLVEIQCCCPTYFARYNYKFSAVEMMYHFKEKAVNIAKYNQLSEEEKKKHVPIGKLYESNEPDFHSKYLQLQKRAELKSDC
ncbi:MAG: thiamine pyrophosphate-dependent enzyme [Peptococcaceae bacterium]